MTRGPGIDQEDTIEAGTSVTVALSAPAAPPAAGEAGLSPRRLFRPQTLISLLIAFAALYFFFTRGLNLDLQAVWGRMQSANLALLALAFGVYYTSFLVRGLRWQTLLGNVGYRRDRDPALPSLFGLTEILYLSWFANCVTIARLGDAYRGYLLKKNANVSFPVTLGTIVAERLLDLGVLAGLLGLALVVAFRGALPVEDLQVLAAGLALVGLSAVGLFLLPRLRPLAVRPLPARWHHHYANLEQGVLGSFKRLPRLIGLSLAGWLIESATLYLTARAVGAPVSVSGAVVVALVGSLLTIVPFTPAGLGVSEAGMVLLLGQFGVEASAASAIALLNRVINYWSIVLGGGILYLFSRKK